MCIQFGSGVKLPGSGGAVVGLCMDPDRLVNLFFGYNIYYICLYVLFSHKLFHINYYFSSLIIINIDEAYNIP